MSSIDDDISSPSVTPRISVPLISDELRQSLPEVAALISSLSDQVRLLTESNQALRDELTLLRHQIPSSHKKWVSTYVQRCLAASGVSLSPSSSTDSPSASSPILRPPRAQSYILSKVPSFESIHTNDGSSPRKQAKTPRSNKQAILKQIRLRSEEPSSSASSLEVHINPLLRTTKRGDRSSLKVWSADSIAVPEPQFRRPKSANAVALLSIDSGPTRTATIAAGVFSTRPSPPGALIASDAGYLMEWGACQEVLQSLQITPLSQMGLKSVAIDLAETTFEREFYGTPFVAMLSGQNSNDPIIVCSHPIDPLDVHKKSSVILRTPRGTDVLAMEASQIDTLFQMSGTDSVVTEIPADEIQDELLQFSVDQRSLYQRFKIGILLSIGEQSEDEMFSNEKATPLFQQFLDWLALPIQLQGWEGFRGGLDVKNGSTGEQAYYTEMETDQNTKLPLLFHVSTLLPYNPHDLQQLERKRHLGNDIIVIVFREQSSAPFDPHIIKSHFNFVFVVVHPVLAPDNSELALAYDVNVCCKEDVPPFGPYLPSPPRFELNEQSRQFFLLKLANAERSALEAPDFAKKLERSRLYQLQVIVDKYSPSTSEDPKKPEESKKSRSRIRRRIAAGMRRTLA